MYLITHHSPNSHGISHQMSEPFFCLKSNIPNHNKSYRRNIFSHTQITLFSTKSASSFQVPTTHSITASTLYGFKTWLKLSFESYELSVLAFIAPSMNLSGSNSPPPSLSFLPKHWRGLVIVSTTDYFKVTISQLGMWYD